MAKRLVLAVHQAFTMRGAVVMPGAVISDPDDVAMVQAAHPEKVSRSMHDFDDAPPPEPAAPPARAPVAAPAAASPPKYP
jgi:hypothetical protein